MVGVVTFSSTKLSTFTYLIFFFFFYYYSNGNRLPLTAGLYTSLGQHTFTFRCARIDLSSDDWRLVHRTWWAGLTTRGFAGFASKSLVYFGVCKANYRVRSATAIKRYAPTPSLIIATRTSIKHTILTLRNLIVTRFVVRQAY